MHFLKKALLETVQKALGVFNEAVERGVEYKHWLEDSVLIAIYRETFKDYFKVLGVSVELRPWHRSTGEHGTATTQRQRSSQEVEAGGD